jgi:AraC-like DNA-binding protein
VSLERVAPPIELSPWIEHLWSVSWALPPGTTHRSQVLTHPTVHLTVEWGTGPRHGFAMPAALVHGVVTRTFSIDLTGSGEVLGLRFRPGGFGAFTGRSVADWTDRVVALVEVFGADAATLTDAVVGEADLAARARTLCGFLGARLPDPDPVYDRLLGVVAIMLDDRTLTTVKAVANSTGLSTRTLQRLFHRYVGVGPKWVLQRFRLHDAVGLIDAGEVDDLAALAATLGWYDQAHFGRDFTDVVGVPPGRYLADARASAAPG